HVLHRLSTPRHPPSTLSNLTTFLSRSLARELLFKSRSIVGDHIPELSKISSSAPTVSPPCGGDRSAGSRFTGGSGAGAARGAAPATGSSVESGPPSLALSWRAASSRRARGGGDRNRTCDPLLAKQELYH